MARYVVLHFEDNDEAEVFTRKAMYENDDGQFSSLLVDKIRALVPAPTLFCEDPYSQHGNKKAGYFRGKKYGWWVCSVCGKPTEAWGGNYRGPVSAGLNLLTEEQIIPPPGYDQSEGTT